MASPHPDTLGGGGGGGGGIKKKSIILYSPRLADLISAAHPGVDCSLDVNTKKHV